MSWLDRLFRASPPPASSPAAPAPTRAPGIDFLGIGAQKAGTTWLHTRLAGHPGAFLPPEKEVHYWSAFKDRGLDWYRTLFAAARPDQQRGEITPAYAVLDPAVIREIHDAFPDLKLFYILRNPVERAWSSALMNLHRAEMKFSEASDQWFIDHFQSSGSLQRGDYAQCLENWSNIYGRERILVLLFEDIRRDPRGLLDRLARHIALDPGYFAQEQEEAVRRAELVGSGDKIRPALRRRLVDLYTPKIEALERATGLDLSSWHSANAREERP